MKNVSTVAFLAIAPVSIILLRVPVPSPVLDILIAVHLLFALVVFIIAICTRKASNLSLLPALLLMSIFFGTSLYIAVARSILTAGSEYDGRLIRFVSLLLTGSGGIDPLITSSANFFIIIALVIYVISEGVRVAENAASQKAALQTEADLFDDLDVFMRLLSATVKINLFIIAVIFLGGLLTDTVDNGKSITDVIVTYIPIAVGSGILFMIPSLLLSIAVMVLLRKEDAKNV